MGTDLPGTFRGVCPRSELLALREEVQRCSAHPDGTRSQECIHLVSSRMRKEAMDVAGLKAEVEVLKAGTTVVGVGTSSLGGHLRL